MNEEVVRVRLTGIAGRGHHGVFDEERREGQLFVVDVAVDVRRPPDSDALADTVDYGELAAAVLAAIERDPVDLIETLAGRIADTCLERPRVESATVTVHKPHAPMPVPVADASVTLTRRKSP